MGCPHHHEFHLAPPSSLHAGGVNMLFCDGHVRFVNENISEWVFRATGTMAGGEVFGEF